MIIAVDFDGTIVEHRYPEIGKPILFAFDALKELQKRDHRLILWTYRAGKELQEAIDFCRENGIEFHAHNANHPDEDFDATTMSRKIHADLFIDDRNVGGFPGWTAILHMIHPEEFGLDEEEQGVLDKAKKWWAEVTRS